MKHEHQSHYDQSQRPVNISPLPMEMVEAKHNGIDYGPSKHEVAKRAYYIFLNQGSRSGYDIQHWQEAEAQLVEERNCSLDCGVPQSSKK